MIKEFAKTIIVPCAGRSSRFGAGGKWRADINGMHLLGHVMAPWIGKCEKWIFAAGPNDDMLPVFLDEIGITCEIVVQPRPAGIADAVARAAAHVGTPFTVLLGDCVVNGEFSAGSTLTRGIGVWQGEHPSEVKENYGVHERDGLVRRVVEKPADPSGLMCGMGVYFFDSELFSFLQSAVEKSGGDAHITGILQSWVESGRELSSVSFNGIYVNVNTVDDLATAARLLGSPPHSD